MRSILPAFLLSVVFCCPFAAAQPSQTNPRLGTWELRPAESRYADGQIPMNEMRTVEPQGSGERISVEGTASDGHHIEYSYATSDDGRETRISGDGQPFGADTVSQKRMDTHATMLVEKRAGKIVATGTNVVSADGKTMTITLRGVAGQPSVTSVWQR